MMFYGAIKLGAHKHLGELLKAKAYSDKGQYKEKKWVMGPLLANNPQDFIVDTSSHMPGITHIPTGFRMHVPSSIIPSSVKHAEVYYHGSPIKGLTHLRARIQRLQEFN